jgi:putative FmdB family regulatory protein
MPIYEYRCKKCQNKFEELVGLGTRDEDMVCPGCGSSSVERAFSVFGVLGGAETEVGESGAYSGASACSGCAATSCATCVR